MNTINIKEFTIISEDGQFKEELENLITCKICLEVVKNPQQCKTCENVYCEICLSKWKNECPMRCQNQNQNEIIQTNFKPSKVFLNLYQKIKLNCRGCSKNVLAEDFQDHDEDKISNKIIVKTPENFDYKKQYYEMLTMYSLLKSKYETASSNSIYSINQKEMSELVINYVHNFFNKVLKYYAPNSLSDFKFNGNRFKVDEFFGFKVFKYSVKNCSHVKSTFVPIFTCCQNAYPCVTCHDNYCCKSYGIEFIYCKRCFSLTSAWSSKKCGYCQMKFVITKK